MLALDARGTQPVEALAGWCKPGRTVAFPRLVRCRQVHPDERASGRAIRRHAGYPRGRREGPAHHDAARTSRGARRLPRPRHAGHARVAADRRRLGIADLFDDLETLAGQCRFSDCRHETEPGCAIRAALEDGRLDPARLARWRKLQAEDAFKLRHSGRAPGERPRLRQAGARRPAGEVGSRALGRGRGAACRRDAIRAVRMGTLRRMFISPTDAVVRFPEEWR